MQGIDCYPDPPLSVSDMVEGGDGRKKATSLPYLRRAYLIYVEPCRALLWEDNACPLCPPVPPVHAIIQASPAVSWSRAAVRYCWGASLPPFPAISWSNPAFFRIKTRLILVKPRLFLVDPRPFLVDPTCPNSLPLPFLWLGAAVGIGSGCVGW